MNPPAIDGNRSHQPNYPTNKPGAYGGNAALNARDAAMNGVNVFASDVQYNDPNDITFDNVFGFVDQDFTLVDGLVSQQNPQGQRDGLVDFGELSQHYTSYVDSEYNGGMTLGDVIQRYDTVIRENQLSAQTLNTVFSQVDLNRDGRLDGREVSIRQWMARDVDGDGRITTLEHAGTVMFEDIAGTGSPDGVMSATDQQYADFARLFDTDYAKSTVNGILTENLEDKYGNQIPLDQRYQHYKGKEVGFYLQQILQQFFQFFGQFQGA